jgi:negative regulator of flagellin synthesis FlgM
VTNKISGYNPSEVLPSTVGNSPNVPAADKGATGAAAASGPQSSTADTATFTGSAQTLQKLSSVLAATPVVNSAKVANIKQAVQNGSYSVNAGSVADKLLHSDSELK